MLESARIAVEEIRLAMPLIKTIRGKIWIADQRRDKNKPTALLIHGAGGSHLSFPVALRKHSSFESILVDLPGHGGSDGSGRGRIADYAEDVLALMDTLQIDTAIVTGHSMGGAVAQWLALNHGERVSGLILIGSGARLPVNPALIKSIVADTEATIQNLLRWMWSKNAPADMKAQSAAIMRETDPSVMQGDFIACDNFEVRGRLAKIEAPTLIIAGEKDKMTPLSLSEELAQGIAQSRLVVIRDAGHMMLLEKAAETAEAIRGWLDQDKG